ncbi:MAG TPA: toll/interleukin-1 receptor domain-containing protein [Thermoanaerobaculia bacterium]|nr:toll/interleukin-1 receptor domain-containing protein [Thermoanaerobaculia bacterium]
MSEAYEYDAFLSYSSQDQGRAIRVAERLRASGLKVWYDGWEIKPGDDIYFKIEEGLNRSRILVFLMSSSSLGSDWTGFERRARQFRDPLNRERRFIPVLLEDCKLPEALASFRYIDLRQDSDAELALLIEACRPAAGTESVAGEATLQQLRARQFPGLSRPGYLR